MLSVCVCLTFSLSLWESPQRTESVGTMILDSLVSGILLEQPELIETGFRAFRPLSPASGVSEQQRVEEGCSTTFFFCSDQLLRPGMGEKVGRENSNLQNKHLGTSLAVQWIKNLPANAEVTGLIPGPGGFHMPWNR